MLNIFMRYFRHRISVFWLFVNLLLLLAYKKNCSRSPPVREPRLANIVQAARPEYRPAQPDIVPNTAPAKTPAANWETGLKSRAPTHDLTTGQDIVKIPDVGSLIVAALNSAAALQDFVSKTGATAPPRSCAISSPDRGDKSNSRG